MRRHPRNRSGFIYIVGWRQLATREPLAPEWLTCPTCGETTWFHGKLRRAWFTMFFIPIWPLENAEEGVRICQCSHCKTTFDCSIEQMRRRARALAGNDWQHSILLYNKLRDDPANPALLNALMETYASMGEPHEAITAAHLFPQALAASPRCQLTLQRLTASADAESIAAATPHTCN